LVLVFLTLVIARHTEHSRRRVRDSAAELLGARLALVGALLLSWLAKRLVPDRERFGKTVFSTRCRVFHQCCTPQVPLVVISTLWEDERVAVVHTTCDNFSFLRLLAGPHVWFVVSSHWAKLRSHFRWHRALAILLDPFQRCDQVLWLGNSPQEVLVARREGCQTAFVNHNCFVNESCFPLASFRARPRFDAVLNANAGAWKRHHLARAVPTLAYITYSRDAHGRMVWPVESFRPAFQNDEYLDERARSTIYRDSCCGLTLSACEGANYATVEYLLSGLPVVSTPSRGGRDIWFTPANSLVCQPSCEGVATAVATWRQRHEQGAVDHARIRAECLARMTEHRQRFVEALQEVLARARVNAVARDIFEAHRVRDALIHSLAFRRGHWISRHPWCAGRGWYRLDALPPALGSIPQAEGAAVRTHEAAVENGAPLGRVW
jgi:glycosyltransferase involved in cell wall biosynthesis